MLGDKANTGWPGAHTYRVVALRQSDLSESGPQIQVRLDGQGLYWVKFMPDFDTFDLTPIALYKLSPKAEVVNRRLMGYMRVKVRHTVFLQLIARMRKMPWLTVLPMEEILKLLKEDVG